MKRTILPLLIFILTTCSGENSEPPVRDQATGSINWGAYLGDYGRTHYSPLTQITRANVAALQVAWIYESGPVRAGNSTLHISPLIIDGLLYGLSPTLDAFALVAATGQELWRYRTGDTGAEQRGLMWWQDGDDRRLLYTAGRELIALNADTGQTIAGFGVDGRVDLSPPGRPGPLFVSFPGVVFEDTVILGFSTSESANALPGSVAAFSIIDGSELWRFHTLPRAGEPGSETWAEGALASAGGANNWTSMTLDEERSMLFIPTGSATPDFFGTARAGDNLFANSLVALDARSGEYRWHFQAVRHDLWDRDFPSPPTLVQLLRDSEIIDAVAVPTKTGHLYLFDRDSGESLYSINEVEAPRSIFVEEQTAPTQPVPESVFTRQEFEITQRNPEATAFVTDLITGLDTRPWVPPSFDGSLIYPSYDGGAGWGGAAYNPDGHKLVVNAQEIGGILQLTRIPMADVNRGTYLSQCGSCHGADRAGTDQAPGLLAVADNYDADSLATLIIEGRGRMQGFAQLSEAERNIIVNYLLSPDTDGTTEAAEQRYNLGFGGYVRIKDHDDLPGNTPPWGTLSSIDLATGAVDWQVNLGNYLSHPNLNLGSENYGGPIVTASGLVFIAATPDQKFRAFDADDGSLLWETDLPAAGFATPAMYSANGSQYIVIAAGGGKLGAPSGAYYVAYSLPAN